MKYKLDEDEKKIIKTIIHNGPLREKRKKAGTLTEFDERAESAIRAAKADLRLDGYNATARRHIVRKLHESIEHNTPWEMLGNTYCGRRLFYRIRQQYMLLIAKHMGLTNGADREENG